MYREDRVKRPTKSTDLLARSSLQNLFGILVRLLRCCDFHGRLDRRHPCSALLFQSLAFGLIDNARTSVVSCTEHDLEVLLLFLLSPCTLVSESRNSRSPTSGRH